MNCHQLETTQLLTELADVTENHRTGKRRKVTGRDTHPNRPQASEGSVETNIPFSEINHSNASLHVQRADSDGAAANTLLNLRKHHVNGNSAEDSCETTAGRTPHSASAYQCAIRKPQSQRQIETNMPMGQASRKMHAEETGKEPAGGAALQRMPPSLDHSNLPEGTPGLKTSSCCSRASATTQNTGINTDQPEHVNALDVDNDSPRTTVEPLMSRCYGDSECWPEAGQPV